jgi:N-acetylneuraminic acid mutarotase
MKRLMTLLAFGTLVFSFTALPDAPGGTGDYQWLLSSPLLAELSATAERYLWERYGDQLEKPVRDRKPEPDLARLKALSQLVNDRNQDNENPNLTGQDETTIAIYGETIVIGYNDSRGFAAGASSATGYSFSHDGGATWTDGGELQPPPGHYSLGDPALAVDRHGNFYFASLSFYPDGSSYIGVAKSIDGGETFTQYADASPGVDPANFQDKEFITVDNSGGPCDGTIYASWTEFFATGGNRILVTASYNGGRSFSWSVQISPSGVQASFPRVGPDGALYVVWRDSVAPGIRVSKSVDCGRTFGADGVNNLLVARAVPYTSFSPECNRITLKGHIRASTSPALSIDQRNGTLYVTYPSNPTGPDQSDVFLVNSTDGGKTWSTPVRVNDDRTNSDQFFPTVAVAGDGTVGVAFYDRRNDPDNLKFDVYLAVSTDGGKTFATNKRLSEVSSGIPEPLSLYRGCYMSDYIYMEADGEYFYTTWGDARNEGRTWKLRAAMNHPRVGAAVAAVGNKIYAIGGNYLLETETTDTNRNEMYDPATDRWTTRASAPTARTGAMAVSQGSFVYVLGGLSTDHGEVLSTVERYNVLLDSWQRMPAMPTARTGFGVAIINHVIYAIGGSDCVFYFNCNSALDKVEAYDLRTGQWATKVPIPTARAEVQATVAFGGKIYVIGGYNRAKGRMLSTVEVYDPATDSWESLPDLPSPRASASAAVCKGNILVMGGYTPQFELRAGTLLFEMDSKKWKPAPTMKLARAEFQTATIANKIYAVGGLDDRSFRRNGAIEAFDCSNTPIGFARPDMDVYFSKDRVHPVGIKAHQSKEASASDTAKIDQVVFEANQFFIEGQGIASAGVQVWTLTGRLVFEGVTTNSHIEFNGLDSNGKRLANGVYLYSVTATGTDGKTVRSQLQKLALRR